jgi:hypothetical protein
MLKSYGYFFNVQIWFSFQRLSYKFDSMFGIGNDASGKCLGDHLAVYHKTGSSPTDHLCGEIAPSESQTDKN